MTAAIKIAIVEDNIDNIGTFEYAISQLTTRVELVGVAKDETEAYALLGRSQDGPGISGYPATHYYHFQCTGKNLCGGLTLPELVFLTAHGSFENAVKAIQFACLDFVTKPFNPDDIEQSLQRYLAKSNTQPSPQAEIGLLLQLLKTDMHTPKSIAIQLSRGIIEMVELLQVVFIEADENISIVHMAEGKTLLSHKTLVITWPCFQTI